MKKITILILGLILSTCISDFNFDWPADFSFEDIWYSTAQTIDCHEVKDSITFKPVVYTSLSITAIDSVTNTITSYESYTNINGKFCTSAIRAKTLFVEIINPKYLDYCDSISNLTPSSIQLIPASYIRLVLKKDEDLTDTYTIKIITENQCSDTVLIWYKHLLNDSIIIQKVPENFKLEIFIGDNRTLSKEFTINLKDTVKFTIGH